MMIGIPMTAFGLMNPMIAGGAMAFSSVSVVSNSLLLKRYDPRSHGRMRGDLAIKLLGATVMAAAIWLAFFYAQPFNTVTYDLTIEAMRLDVGELHAKPGQQVRINLVNANPEVMHQFTIKQVPHRFVKMVQYDPAFMHHVDYDVMIHVAPGKKGTIEFTPTQPGRYEIEDGEFGVHGWLVVEG